MLKYRRAFLICCALVASFVFLLQRRHGDTDIALNKYNSNTLFECNSTAALPSRRGTERDLIFIGESSETLQESMTDDEADIALNKFMSRRHVACEKSVRLGNVLDGGWDMCIAGPYRPRQPCFVYSFGINNDFTFDDAVAKMFGCTVRSFDPSMATEDHQRNANIWFYRIGIGGKDELNSKRWKIRMLSSLTAEFNESNVVIDYLKLDVEGSEWPSLSQMLSNGTLSKVKQLGIELHTDSIRLISTYRLLRQLEEQGFRRWYYALNLYNLRKTANGFRSCCYEMVYINKNFLKQKLRVRY